MFTNECSQIMKSDLVVPYSVCHYRCSFSSKMLSHKLLHVRWWLTTHKRVVRHSVPHPQRPTIAYWHNVPMLSSACQQRTRCRTYACRGDWAYNMVWVPSCASSSWRMLEYYKYIYIYIYIFTYVWPFVAIIIIINNNNKKCKKSKNNNNNNTI